MSPKLSSLKQQLSFLMSLSVGCALFILFSGLFSSALCTVPSQARGPQLKMLSLAGNDILMAETGRQEGKLIHPNAFIVSAQTWHTHVHSHYIGQNSHLVNNKTG